MAEVRRIRRGDGALLRDVRLRALRTDPAAFASSYDREVGRTEADWELRAERAAAGPAQYLVVADQDGRFVGMAGAYQPEADDGVRNLYGMWVSPDNRGEGIGARLVAAVEDWSMQHGAREIRLCVVETNTAAAGLYERSGFRATGETQPLPSDPNSIESRMVLPLG